MLRSILIPYVIIMVVIGAPAQTESPDIQAVYPPSKGDQTKAGAEKFIIFGREVGVATIWEYIPGKDALDRRVSLIASSWAPGLLLRDGPPQLIRQQIPLHGRGYRVNLYDVDYREWNVRRLHTSRQIHGLGMSATSVYVKTDLGLRLVNPLTAHIHTPAEQFRRLFDLGSHWLVELKDGERRGKTALFDPRRRKVISVLDLPPFVRQGAAIPWIKLSPSSRYLAIVEPVPFDRAPSFREWKIATTTIHVVDTKTEKQHALPLRVLVTGGSGRPVLYTNLSIAFDAADRLIYTDIAGEAKELTLPELAEAKALLSTSVQFDPLRVDTREAAIEEANDDKVPSLFVPEYLRAQAKAPVRIPLDLLAEFLEHHDVAQSFRRPRRDGSFGYNHCPVAFSEDGRRFLGALLVNGPRRVFYFGDLERDVLNEVDGLSVVNPAITWIRTPL